MKKVTAVLLSLLLVISALLGLASCGTNKASLNDYYCYLTDYSGGESDWSKAFKAAADAVKAASTTGNSNLYIPKGEYEITGSVVIPVGVTLIFEEGALIKLAAGSSFIMNGRNIIAEKAQIFDVADEAKISGFFSASAGYPEWFGAKVDDEIDDSKAIELAAKCLTTVELSAGVYNVNNSISLNEMAKSFSTLIVNGAGSDKTVLRAAANIKTFNYDGTSAHYPCIEIRNIAFEEAGGARTSFGIFTDGNTAECKVVITDCSFKGFNTAFYTAHSGFVHFNRNYAENNEVVCEIGGGSMFLFYKYNTAVSNGYFIRCDIPPNGGYSNGIDIVENNVSKSEKYDVYIKDNQAVFIDNCKFEGGFGDASIFLSNVSDYRITDTVITSDPSANGRIGYHNKNSHSGYIYNTQFSGNSTGIYFDGPSGWRNMTYVNACTFENNSVNDILLRRTGDVKIVGNQFKTAFAHSGNNDVEIKFNDVKVKNVVIAENTFASKSIEFGKEFGIESNIEYGNVFNG
ncbi:MAG: hypothetical protein IJD95_03165 [Clostridia bacterium]|nr:hypothetical protein [Clostridia bacterium]